MNRTYPAEKYLIQEYADKNNTDNVEDDLSEISSMVFTTLTDAAGSRFAYVASDKNQFSLKVIKFINSTDTKQVITGTATTAAVYTLTNIGFSNSDWEDISLGPCSSDASAGAGETCIYIGNFGNNALRNGSSYVPRTEVEIFKFREPAFDNPLGGPVNRTIKAAIITYNYANFFPNAPKADAEAMFVDWTGAHGVGKGDIYVVLKGGCNGVGRILASHHQNLNLDPDSASANKLVNVGPIEHVILDDPVQGTSIRTLICHNTSEFRVWSGADMSRNGRMIAMITAGSPARVYFFPRATGQSVVDALSQVGCDYVSATSFGLPNERQHEAVAFVNEEGTIFAETSECDSGRACKVPTYVHHLIFPGEETTSMNYSLVWTTITYDDFETTSLAATNYTTSPINSTDPDAVLSNAASCRGSQSVKLRWDKGNSSSIFHKSNRDCSTYAYLKVTFQFRLVDFKHMDSIFLELSLDGGQDYYIVNSWSYDVNGITQNGVCYQRSVELDARDFGGRQNFGNQTRLRFRSSADLKGDTVFIDDIKFEGRSANIILR